MKRLLLACLPLFLSSPSHAYAAAPPADDVSWLSGSWEKTADEDKAPADVVEFLANGSFVTFGPNCQATFNSYFVRDGFVYVTVIGTNGPIALMFVPSVDHKKLTFTSPRTFHLATYEKTAAPACKRKA
jgi:hypothetical protein